MADNSIFCPTKKKCFGSQEEAVSWEEDNRLKYPNITKQYAYACEDRPNWHLTSKPPEAYGMAQSTLKPVMGINSNVPVNRAQQTERRYRLIWELMDKYPDIDRRDLAEKIYEPLEMTFNAAYVFLKNHADNIAARGKPIEVVKRIGIDNSLQTLSERRLALAAELKRLEEEEERLIEHKKLKLMVQEF